MSCFLLLLVDLLNVFVDRVTDTGKDTNTQNTMKDKDVSDWVESQQQVSRDQSESGYGTTRSVIDAPSDEGDDDLASGSQDDHLESQTVAEVHKSMFPYRPSCVPLSGVVISNWCGVELSYGWNGRQLSVGTEFDCAV